MIKKEKLPEWAERPFIEKIFCVLFVISGIVAAYTMFYTVFVDYSLWVLEEAAIGLLLITDALSRWNYCGKAPRIEMCIGILVTIALLAGMWIS